MISERTVLHQKGIPVVVILLVLLIAWVALSIWAGSEENEIGVTVAVFLLTVTIFCCRGLIIVNPNQATVVQLFGKYSGSVKQAGFWWVNPFTTRKTVSLRIHNFETGKLKVNDQDGNPIEIAAVVVWNVVDTAEAAFNVEDYKDFVHVQSEAAVRNLATSFPYDAHEEGKQSLRGNTNEIAVELQKEIQDRLAKAGITVIEARISHLAYAPEIASAMLRRQQANAIIAARQRIVEGAVSMVQMALTQLEESHTVKLDEERKAAMVSNLLVVLTSDRDAQPVVNTGTLYQ
ncbi:MAG: SPFH domain-containing protein [Patescibacteria group bacterium]